MDVGWVRAAHADAWEELGRQRARSGGGSARLPGVRLMASGLPYAQWNNGDVDDPSLVDLDAVRRWYAERGVPWGLRVPVEKSWPHGTKLFTKRLMGLSPDAFRFVAAPDGVRLRAAAAPDLEAVLSVDTVAFEAPYDVERPWIEPLLTGKRVTVCVAEVDKRVVATGYCVVTNDVAGLAVYVAGIGVLPEFRRQGLAAALSSWLLRRGFASGAALGHLHPDTDAAAAVYLKLGFVEVAGLDIYVDMA